MAITLTLATPLHGRRTLYITIIRHDTRMCSGVPYILTHSLRSEVRALWQ